jgi:hypothetical protein
MTDKKTLWEEIQQKFYNSKAGVILLVLCAAIAFLFKVYDYKKTISKDSFDNTKTEIEKSINIKLIKLNKRLATYTESHNAKIDSVTVLIQEYLAIRSSLSDQLQPETIELETSLMNKLFSFAFEMIKKIKNTNSVREATVTAKLAKPLCNQLLHFCSRTNTCSDGHIQALKTTLYELNKK